MTPTQKGRRSDALYMDTRTTHRRQLCDMVVNREADIEDLKEEMYGLRCDIGRLENENAKLREESDKYNDLYANAIADAEVWHLQWSAEHQENAKLRELVRDMWPHVRHRSRMCDECELPCDTSDECLLYEPMRQRMRELGVGVAK